MSGQAAPPEGRRAAAADVHRAPLPRLPGADAHGRGYGCARLPAAGYLGSPAERVTVRFPPAGENAEARIAAAGAVGNLRQRTFQATGGVRAEQADQVALTEEACYDAASGLIRGDRPIEVRRRAPPHRARAWLHPRPSPAAARHPRRGQHHGGRGAMNVATAALVLALSAPAAARRRCGPRPARDGRASRRGADRHAGAPRPFRPPTSRPPWPTTSTRSGGPSSPASPSSPSPARTRPSSAARRWRRTTPRARSSTPPARAT